MRTDSHVEWTTDVKDGSLVFSGRVNHRDVANLRLSRAEQAIIDIAAENPAELLQCLEIVFRRLAESQGG